jgi:hydrogenase expression/formation protein HypE
MKITMAHGSGGKTSHELMGSIFGKYFSNDVLDELEDAAVVDISGKIAYSTDTFVVTPVEFKGGNIGKLSVVGTCNDLLMMGAEPMYLTCGFVLEEGLEIETLDRVAKAMAEEAASAGVKIVAGDTKVIEGHGGMFINTSGIGIIPEERSVRAANCRPGDKLILSGDLGDHHACILSARMGIENGISSDCACLHDITDALFENHIDVRTMRDVTRGGLGTIMNEIAETSGCRFNINEEDVPVNEEVKGFCGILGLDPFYMGNEGKLIAVVSEEQAVEALEIIRGTKHGKNARIIGEAVEGSGVYVITKLGGSRVLDMLYGEGLPRIC